MYPHIHWPGASAPSSLPPPSGMELAPAAPRSWEDEDKDKDEDLPPLGRRKRVRRLEEEEEEEEG